MISNRQFFELSEPTNLRWPKIPSFFYLAVIIIAASIGLVLSQLLGILLLVPFFGVDLLTSETQTTAQLTGVLVFTFLPLFPAVWLILQLFEKRDLASVGMELGNAGRLYLRGVGIGLLMLGGAVLVMRLAGFAAVESPFNGQSIAGAFLVLIGWIVQGAGEEVLTRGLLLQIFGRIAGPITGIIVSAGIFTALHGANSNVGPIPFTNLFLFGIFAALYTLYEGGLWGIFAIHSVWNWAQGNLFGFEVSGNEIESAIVLDMMETGPDLWTGGAFGPEGGLIVTFVLVIAIAAVVIADRRRRAAGA